jgi:hypothetical protein
VFFVILLVEYLLQYLASCNFVSAILKRLLVELISNLMECDGKGCPQSYLLPIVIVSPILGSPSVFLERVQAS